MHYSDGLKCMPSNLKPQTGAQPRRTSLINAIASSYYIRQKFYP